MSLALQVDGLTYRYPGQPDPLFKNLSFTLYQGDSIALLGANGAGKTTLLKLLTGELEPAGGTVIRQTAPYLLRQEDLRGGQVLDALLAAYTDLGPLWAEAQRLESEGVPDPLRYADVLSAFAERGGYEVRQALESHLDELNLSPELLTRHLTQLSGGERRLLKLVAAFARPQPLYLLDEPTNYLDERGVRYLEPQINSAEAACLIVSHDRRFLDNTVTGVWELERGQFTRYSGNYSDFRYTKDVHYRESVRESGKLKRSVAQLKEQERSYKVWGARKEKEKSGATDKGFIGARAARLTKRGVQAKQRLREEAQRLEQIKPWVEKRYEFLFETPELPGGVCLNASFASGQPKSLRLEWGERVALTGANGAGKTTLLDRLVGMNEDTVLWHAGATIGYLPQRWDANLDAGSAALRLERSLHDKARTLLGALNVKGERFSAPTEQLSEGQKRKIRLVELILRRPNVLVLDEPTTHLDYRSIEQLEAALQGFPGTLLLVTHDRQLREQVTEREVRVGEP